MNKKAKRWHCVDCGKKIELEYGSCETCLSTASKILFRDVLARWGAIPPALAKYRRLVREQFGDPTQHSTWTAVREWLIDTHDISDGKLMATDLNEVNLLLEAKADDSWLPAETPSECAKRIGRHITTLKRYIENGTVRRFEPHAPRLWRLLREDVAKLGGRLD